MSSEISYYDNEGNPHNSDGEFLLIIESGPKDINGGYPMTEIPLGNTQGLTFPHPDFTIMTDMFTQWWGDAGLDQRKTHRPQPYVPKTTMPNKENAENGINDGIYKVELDNRKIIDVYVDKTGRGSLKDSSLDENTKKSVISRAETLFRELYNSKNHAQPLDDKNHTQYIYQDEKGDIKTTTDISIAKPYLKNVNGYFKGISFNNVYNTIRFSLFIDNLKRKGIKTIPMKTNFDKIHITKQVIEYIEKNVRESIDVLRNHSHDIKNNLVPSIKIAELNEFPANTVGRYDTQISNTLFASNFLTQKIAHSDLIKMAKNNESISVAARVALVPDVKNNKIDVNLVKADGVLISDKVRVVEVQYNNKTGTYGTLVKDSNFQMALTTERGFSSAGLAFWPAAASLDKDPALVPGRVTIPQSVTKTSLEAPYPHQINDAILVFPEKSGLLPIYVYSSYARTRYLDEKDNRSEQEKAFEDIKSAVKFTADFYKDVFEHYGDKAEKIAQSMAQQAKNKKFNNAANAEKLYKKHTANLDKKIKAADRAIIAEHLKSLTLKSSSDNLKIAADNLKKFSKGMKFTSWTIDGYDLLVTELSKAIETGNWRPFYVKAETIIAGMAASAVVGFAFSVLLALPYGIIAYGLIMAGVGAMIDEKFIEEVNKLLGV